MDQTDHADLTWRRSSFCDAGYCLEVARAGDSALVRDGKRPEIGHLTFGLDAWTAFIHAVGSDEFPVAR
jgi:hypothetical protein